jgi:hypothetical protein
VIIAIILYSDEFDAPDDLVRVKFLVIHAPVWTAFAMARMARQLRHGCEHRREIHPPSVSIR